MKNPDIGNTPKFKFCQLSGDWGKLGTWNLAEMSLIKPYIALQNARFTAFTIYELLRKNQKWGGGGGGGADTLPFGLQLIHWANLP